MSSTTKAPIHVCICTPCYGGAVFQNYLLSVIGLIHAAQTQNQVAFSFVIRGGDSLITRSRNSIVAEFLSEPAYTHLLWIDADIGFTAEAVFRLIASDHDVAAGIYPLKTMNWPAEIPEKMTPHELSARYTSYPFNPIGLNFDVKDGFVEVRDAPTGLMLIKRSVFDRMIEAYPELKYTPDHMHGLEGIAAKIADKHYRFFDTMAEPNNGRYLSEDYAFCRRWQNIGGKVYADANSKLTHIGQHTYSGDFALMLNTKYTRA